MLLKKKKEFILFVRAIEWTHAFDLSVRHQKRYTSFKIIIIFCVGIIMSSSSSALDQMCYALQEAIRQADAATMKLQQSVESLRVYAMRQPRMCIKHPFFQPLFKSVLDQQRAEQHRYIVEIADASLQTLRKQEAQSRLPPKPRLVNVVKETKTKTQRENDARTGRNSFARRLERLEKLIKMPKLDVEKAKPLLAGLLKMPLSEDEVMRSNAIAIVTSLDRHPNSKISKLAIKVAKRFKVEIKLAKLRNRPKGETEDEQMARLKKKAKLIEAKHAREKHAKRARSISMKKMQNIKKQKVTIQFSHLKK